MGKSIDSISQSSMDGLCNYRWPGNVRELQNIIERAVIITTGSTLQVDLPGSPVLFKNQRRSLDEVQKEYILDTLETTHWRIRGKDGAAEMLGIKPTTLESRMAKLGIRRPKKRPVL